jgi:hypothetical protein
VAGERNEYIPCFCGKVVTVHLVWPDALDDLEDLVANIELVVKLRVCASALTLVVELHQSMQQVLHGELVSKQCVSKNALWMMWDLPYSMEENGNQAGLQVWVLDVL